MLNIKNKNVEAVMVALVGGENKYNTIKELLCFIPESDIRNALDVLSRVGVVKFNEEDGIIFYSDKMARLTSFIKKTDYNNSIKKIELLDLTEKLILKNYNGSIKAAINKMHMDENAYDSIINKLYAERIIAKDNGEYYLVKKYRYLIDTLKTTDYFSSDSNLSYMSTLVKCMVAKHKESFYEEIAVYMTLTGIE